VEGVQEKAIFRSVKAQMYITTIYPVNAIMLAQIEQVQDK
jgi:hypothetical protein